VTLRDTTQADGTNPVVRWTMDMLFPVFLS
jgi:hypothetical protein